MNSIHFEQVQKEWELIVIGAGPAGASLAVLASRSGIKTLLVEAKKFPREKVCGGCLNQRAQASLDRLEILDSLKRTGAVGIDRLDLRVENAAVNWSIPQLLSVRRSTLDSLIVETAVAAGAQFLSETIAVIRPDDRDQPTKRSYRQVVLRHGDSSCVVEAKLVIAADGLTRSSWRALPERESLVRSDARIGVQAIVEADELDFLPSINCLRMLVAKDGYVGISHTDGGKVDVAGAIDPDAVERYGGISKAVEKILSHCSRSAISMGQNRNWLSTPRLTRESTHVSAHRLLSIGDSNGYVEPFTGEGISWALASAEAVFPLVISTIKTDWRRENGETWSRWVRDHRLRKQRECRWLAYSLRRPQFAASVLSICDRISPIRSILIRKAVS